VDTVSTPNKRAVVYLPPDLERWLEQESRRRHESVGAVIRRAVRKVMEPLTGCEVMLEKVIERGEVTTHED
jgi:hypothetical protein